METRHKARVEVSDILPLALTLVVAGIGIAFGIDVLDSTREDFCDTGEIYNSTANSCQESGNTSVTNQPASLNASTDSITGVAKFSSKMGLIATVIVAAIVIGLLVRFLFFR